MGGTRQELKVQPFSGRQCACMHLSKHIYVFIYACMCIYIYIRVHTIHTQLYSYTIKEYQVAGEEQSSDFGFCTLEATNIVE